MLQNDKRLGHKMNDNHFITFAGTIYVPKFHIKQSPSIFSCLLHDCDDKITDVWIPDKYTSVEIQNYISYLLFRVSRYKITITTFEFCEYAGDNGYLRHIARCLMNDWDTNQDLIHSLNPNTRKDLYSYCALHLLPDYLLNDDTFLINWCHNCGNKKFEIHTTNINNVTNDNVSNITTYVVDVYKYDDGKIRRIVGFKNDVIHGLDKIWFPDGTVACQQYYCDGKLHGTKTSYYYLSGNKQCEEQFQHGISHGVKQKWYSNGTRHSYEQYKDGNRHGITIYWYFNGVDNINIININVNDVNNNIINNNNINNNVSCGNMNIRYSYFGGKPHGVFETWYKSGRRESHCHYYHGSGVGTHHYWLQDTDNADHAWRYNFNYRYIKNKFKSLGVKKNTNYGGVG